MVLTGTAASKKIVLSVPLTDFPTLKFYTMNMYSTGSGIQKRTAPFVYVCLGKYFFGRYIINNLHDFADSQCKITVTVLQIMGP